MQIEGIIGKTIIDVYTISGIEQGWLDTAECFIELEDNLIIGLPYGFSEDVWIKKLDPKAESIFKNLADYPVYHVNKEGKSIGGIAKSYQSRESNIFNRLRKALFGHKIIIKEYQPYKVDYRENKLKYIQNRKVIDFLWYDDESEKGFLELENGYIITETTMSPSGTGLAGLNYYESLKELTDTKGIDYLRITEKMKGSR